jgi:hypothetical protein
MWSEGTYKANDHEWRAITLKDEAMAASTLGVAIGGRFSVAEVVLSQIGWVSEQITALMYKREDSHYSGGVLIYN